MQCEKFEARLQDLLDQRARPEFDARLLEHAEACDNCRETLLLQEQLFTGLELWEAPSVSDGFAQRVLAQYAAETPVTRSADRSGTDKLAWKVLAGVVAASLLIGVIVAASLQNAGAAKPETPSVAINPESVAPVAAAPKTQVAERPVPGTAGPSTAPLPLEISLPDQLAQQFVSVAPNFSDGRATGRMIREATYSLPEVTLAEDSIPGLQPIASSFSLTIGMVRRTLPGGRENSPRQDEPKPQPVSKPQAEAQRADGDTAYA